MALEDDGTSAVQDAYVTPSYFEHRRAALIGSRQRKRKFTAFRKDEETLRAARLALLRQEEERLRAERRIERQRARAARRLAVALIPPTVPMPLYEEPLDGWPTACSAEIYEYCAYVRATITADGIAAALGLKRHRVANALSQLASEGLLRKERLLRRRRSGATAIWEWVGP